MDFRAIKSAYLIGIKGVGMTALAQVLKKRGVAVSGSDTAENFYR
jgi:UDP-N-acetylmuramate-alanine ligase